MNDLVTPFLVVFLSEHIEMDEVLTPSSQTEAKKNQLIEKLTTLVDLKLIESDTFWCTSCMLDSLQDNYTFAQPAIQSSVRSMELLTRRVDRPLYDHLVNNGIEFLQFSFRWMNNLLMRELPLMCVIRLFDAYHAEGKTNFVKLHVYVCVALLRTFARYIKQQTDFQSIMISLQNLPTSNWTTSRVDLLLAEAYSLQCLFSNCPKHLNENTNSLPNNEPN